MKRKVTYVLGPWREHPLEARECIYKQITIETSEENSLRPLAIAVENNGGLVPSSGEEHRYQDVGTIVNGHEIDELVARLLTYVDATYSDVKQRKAHKDLVRRSVWDWFKAKQRAAEKTIAFAIKEKV